ncbi:putative isomerase [Armadillidium vulgare]|nr:putative isomerase [Armadillidium vulgare]
MELNLSETAYVKAQENSSPNIWKEGNKFGLRWFTPTIEFPLCGHATLATAHALFNILGNTSDSIAFETLSGTLWVKKHPDGISMDFPLNKPEPLTVNQQEKYRKLINAVTGNKKVKETLLSKSSEKLMIRLEDYYTRTDFQSLSPNPRTLLELYDGNDIQGVIVTLQGDLHRNQDTSRGLQEYNFASRYFAPWVGIPEDPVCGSAHTVLGPYWSEQLNLKELKCRQSSNRGGDITLRIRDDNRVDIIGKGTTVIEGEINI